MERFENPITGKITYKISDDQWIDVDPKELAEHGITKILKMHDIQPPEGRLDVHQSGRKIGTVPATFEPSCIKSQSFFYDPRGGDFKREGNAWIADRALGPGDLDAIPGFVWDQH
jgi:hypothetical protein